MDLNAFADAVASAAPAEKLRRRMGKVVAINTNRTINVQIAGSTTTITGVHYFNHYAPKLNTQVWLDTDGRDWIAIGAIAGSGGAVPTVKVHRTADLSVATGSTYTAVPWQAAEYDPWGMWTSGTNVVVPITGRYLVTGQASWLGNNTGYRTALLQYNGGTANFGYAQSDAGTTNQFSLSVSGIRTATAGDYFSLNVRQGSGVTLGLMGTASVYTHMTVTYLGSDA